MDSNLTVEQAMQQARGARLDNITKVVSPELNKAVAAQEGEQREWGGKKYVKQNGQWIPLVEGKDKGDAKKQKPGTDDKSQPPQGGGNQVEIDKHELAQLTHMKSVVDSDPNKAYEIFLSLTPEAQHKVPQQVVDKMVQSSHSNDKDEQNYEDLGEGKSQKHPLEGKHYKDMDVNQLREVAKIMKVKVQDNMGLAKLRSAVGDAIINENIKQSIKKFQDGKSDNKK